MFPSSNAIDFDSALSLKWVFLELLPEKRTLSLKRKNATNHSDRQNFNQLQYALCYNLMKSVSQELQQIETQAES